MVQHLSSRLARIKLRRWNPERHEGVRCHPFTAAVVLTGCSTTQPESQRRRPLPQTPMAAPAPARSPGTESFFRDTISAPSTTASPVSEPAPSASSAGLTPPTRTPRERRCSGLLAAAGGRGAPARRPARTGAHLQAALLIDLRVATVGGNETLWLAEEAKIAYVAELFLAALVTAHAACERELAGRLTLRLDEVPRGWERWGLGKLTEYAQAGDFRQAPSVVRGSTQKAADAAARRPFRHNRHSNPTSIASAPGRST